MSVADDYALPGEQTPPAEQPPTGGQLRKQLEDALAVNKALQERVTAQEASQRKRDLTDLVKGAGLPDAAAARYPADAEVTPEKVTEWANAEKAYAQQLAGVQPTPPTPEVPGAPAAATAPPVGVTPQAQAAAQKVAAAAAGASPPTEGLEGMYARLQDRSVSWPQLQAELAAMGFKDQ